MSTPLSSFWKGLGILPHIVLSCMVIIHTFHVRNMLEICLLIHHKMQSLNAGTGFSLLLVFHLCIATGHACCFPLVTGIFSTCTSGDVNFFWVFLAFQVVTSTVQFLPLLLLLMKCMECNCRRFSHGHSQPSNPNLGHCSELVFIYNPGVLQVGLVLEKRIAKYVLPVLSFILVYSKLPHKVSLSCSLFPCPWSLCYSV